jgi:hypothetical protein
MKARFAPMRYGQNLMVGEQRARRTQIIAGLATPVSAYTKMLYSSTNRRDVETTKL